MDDLIVNLKNCPFCGGKAVIFVNNGISVQCTRCGCKTPSYTDGIVYGNSGGSLRRVVEKWNNRPVKGELRDG